LTVFLLLKTGNFRASQGNMLTAHAMRGLRLFRDVGIPVPQERVGVRPTLFLCLFLKDFE